MSESWIERWDERYSKPEFAYGVQPNNFLKEQVEKLIVSTILLKLNFVTLLFYKFYRLMFGCGFNLYHIHTSG